MAKLGYCWPCQENGRRFVQATVLLDGDPHCKTCAQSAVATQAVPIPSARSSHPKVSDTIMDVLVCEEIDAAQVPVTAKQPRTVGRLGVLYQRLNALGADKWLKVVNRDRTHAMSTVRHTMTRAKKNGRSLEWKLDNTTLYCRLEAR